MDDPFFTTSKHRRPKLWACEEGIPGSIFFAPWGRDSLISTWMKKKMLGAEKTWKKRAERFFYKNGPCDDNKKRGQKLAMTKQTV